jgi:hypothetical protein
MKVNRISTTNAPNPLTVFPQEFVPSAERAAHHPG